MKSKVLDISSFTGKPTIESTKQTIANNVRNLRKQLKWSQQELAKQANVSYGSIKRFESNGEISIDSLLRIANSLDRLNEFNEIFKGLAIKDLSEAWK